MIGAVTHARFGSLVARHAIEVRRDLSGLEQGFWAVVADFEGDVTAVRFAEVTRPDGPPAPATPPAPWAPLEGRWSSSLDEAAYLAGVAGGAPPDRGGHRLPGQPLPGALTPARRGG